MMCINAIVLNRNDYDDSNHNIVKLNDILTKLTISHTPFTLTIYH